ncbi:hypothetical protein HDU76_001886 [Blyttiomyces sp. JEL0837]|nr:hypothetical protein HDU76_001886 [Blyttiomyces sp. JEL0837]
MDRILVAIKFSRLEFDHDDAVKEEMLVEVSAMAVEHGQVIFMLVTRNGGNKMRRSQQHHGATEHVYSRKYLLRRSNTVDNGNTSSERTARGVATSEDKVNP